ncbi:HEPN domain-containing protein [Methanoculleus frigidifontis]|uniref:HEPN domain-containing protein n=1 Tax=Methanoculleus frigidifontis TaxID=2584085 RepID=UPI002659D255|nr:HEPN domain-containing protein [Methanoculleus sp. FWC-SCC1]
MRGAVFVVDLLKGLQQRHDVPQNLFGIARSLDRSYVPARYPDGFPRGKPADYFGREDADDAVGGAERIIQFCDGLLA